MNEGCLTHAGAVKWKSFTGYRLGNWFWIHRCVRSVCSTLSGM